MKIIPLVKKGKQSSKNPKYLILIIIASLCSCTVIYRGIRYGTADIDDYKIFPQAEIKCGEYKYYEIVRDKYHYNNWKIFVYRQPYSAFGILGQMLYVDPETNIIIVRLGKDDDRNLNALMFNIGKALKR